MQKQCSWSTETTPRAIQLNVSVKGQEIKTNLSRLKTSQRTHRECAWVLQRCPYIFLSLSGEYQWRTGQCKNCQRIRKIRKMSFDPPAKAWMWATQHFPSKWASQIHKGIERTYPGCVSSTFDTDLSWRTVEKAQRSEIRCHGGSNKALLHCKAAEYPPPPEPICFRLIRGT